MRISLLAAALAMLGTAGILAVSSVEAKGPQVLPNTTTQTDVCLVYAVDGVYSGGVAVVAPETVSYQHLGNSGKAFLWLPNQERIKVDSLSVDSLPPGETNCVGILEAVASTSVVRANGPIWKQFPVCELLFTTRNGTQWGLITREPILIEVRYNPTLDEPDQLRIKGGKLTPVSEATWGLCPSSLDSWPK